MSGNPHPGSAVSFLSENQATTTEIDPYTLWPSAEERAAVGKELLAVMSTMSGERVPAPVCQTRKSGDGFGEHEVCEFNAKGCFGMSYGISRDWSFDVDMKERGCSMFLFDPSVTHPSLLDGMPFFRFGAAMLPTMTLPQYPSGSVPMMAKALGRGRPTILKMDCEGCEFQLARSVIQDDPHFFDDVAQLVIEGHSCHTLMEPPEEAEENWSALLVMLKRSGLRIMHYHGAHCAAQRPPWTELQFFPKTHCCHNFLFANPARVVMPSPSDLKEKATFLRI